MSCITQHHGTGRRVVQSCYRQEAGRECLKFPQWQSRKNTRYVSSWILILLRLDPLPTVAAPFGVAARVAVLHCRSMSFAVEETPE
jgi:hypothetical protein